VSIQQALIEQSDGVYFWVKATPQSAKNEIVGIEQVQDQQYAIKIKLKAKPIDGAANEALIKYLSEKLGIRTQQITLLSGQTARIKRLKCEAMTRDVFLEKMGL
jgi:uncharacterized protein (TIGR00251 family)